MKKICNIAGMLTVLASTAGAFAAEVVEHAEHAEASAAQVPLPYWPLIKTVLLGTLWLFVAAIILGPLVKGWIGDLWQRKTNQPFSDDGGSHGHAAASQASHH